MKYAHVPCDLRIKTISHSPFIPYSFSGHLISFFIYKIRAEWNDRKFLFFGLAVIFFFSAAALTLHFTSQHGRVHSDCSIFYIKIDRCRKKKKTRRKSSDHFSSSSSSCFIHRIDAESLRTISSQMLGWLCTYLSAYIKYH